MKTKMLPKAPHFRNYVENSTLVETQLQPIGGKSQLKMKIIFLFVSFLLISNAGLWAQKLPSSTRSQILSTLENQENAWNEGNLENFMIGYWKSDSLLFIGKNGLTKGWNQTLSNYKKGYPDKSAMGKLTFGILKMEALGKSSVLVVGSWRLDREKDVLEGHFSLIWKKMDGIWCIVADHSS